MKSLLKLFIGIALLAYIILAVTKFSKGDNTEACKHVNIEVTDSAQAVFISGNEVKRLLEKKHLYPEGIPMNKIQLAEMEKVLESHQFILDAQCYKTANNAVYVKVSQRLPVMRIISTDGSNYFIDSQGKRIQCSKFPADVIVATGFITPRFAKKYLAAIGRHLQADAFWNSQIEQLHVLSNGAVELIPRVGNHIIHLGPPVKVEQKLERLRLFYSKVLNKVGWNKYNRIDMEFSNQIVCTKKE